MHPRYPKARPANTHDDYAPCYRDDGKRRRADCYARVDTSTTQRSCRRDQWTGERKSEPNGARQTSGAGGRAQLYAATLDNNWTSSAVRDRQQAQMSLLHRCRHVCLRIVIHYDSCVAGIILTVSETQHARVCDLWLAKTGISRVNQKHPQRKCHGLLEWHTEIQNIHEKGCLRSGGTHNQGRHDASQIGVIFEDWCQKGNKEPQRYLRGVNRTKTHGSPRVQLCTLAGKTGTVVRTRGARWWFAACCPRAQRAAMAIPRAKITRKRLPSTI